MHLETYKNGPNCQKKKEKEKKLPPRDYSPILLTDCILIVFFLLRLSLNLSVHPKHSPALMLLCTITDNTTHNFRYTIQPSFKSWNFKVIMIVRKHTTIRSVLITHQILWIEQGVMKQQQSQLVLMHIIINTLLLIRHPSPII